jgi:hypothetical protein
MLAGDVGHEQHAAGSNDADWTAVAAYVRYQVIEGFEPSFRFEYYADPDGFTTGVAQYLTGYTLTLNVRIPVTGKTALMLRPEIRYDKSNQSFFTDDHLFRDDEEQLTFTVGLTWFF